MSKEFSQKDVDSSSNDDFEHTLRAFEISQLNQRHKKPRTSNFIGDFDLQNIGKSRLSICRSEQKMNTIQEDDQSSKSHEEEDEASKKSVTTLSDQEDTKDEKCSIGNS